MDYRGDLNECLWAKEKKGGLAGSSRKMELFREVVGDLTLRDLGFLGDIFTWSNKGKNNPIIMKRLDRFLSNEYFSNLFAFTRASHLD